MGKNVAITTTSGIASCLLFGGQTIHSWAGIGDGRFSAQHIVSELHYNNNKKVTRRYAKKCRIRLNLYKLKYKKIVEKLYLEVNYLDQLTCTEHKLLKSTLQKETLHEIQREQNIASGLAHMTDHAFVFFKALDESLVILETHENMN